MPRFRIFCIKDERDKLPEGIKIEAEYEGFIIVSATRKVIDAIRKQFPVEPLRTARTRSTRQVRSLTSATKQPKGKTGERVVVRFELPVDKKGVAALRKAGLEVECPFGNSAMVGRLRRKDTLAKLKALGDVAQVDLHVPELKLSERFFEGLGVKSKAKSATDAAIRMANKASLPPSRQQDPAPGEVVAVFLSEADRRKAQRALKAAGVPNRRSAPTRLIIELLGHRNPKAAIRKALEQQGLVRIEEKRVRRLHNDVAREVIGADVVEGVATPLTGRGEIVAVCDSGLDTGNAATVHLDFRGRIEDITSYPITLSEEAVHNPGGDDGAADIHSGHGTHVVGSVLGDGTTAASLGLDLIRGMATESRLVFQAIEQQPQWTQAAIDYFATYGITPPAFTASLTT